MRSLPSSLRLAVRTALVASLCLPLASAARAAQPLPVAGRWDVTIESPSGPRGAWFEITESPAGLAMTFQGVAGAPEPVPYVAWDGERLEFQLESGPRWIGTLRGSGLAGTSSTGFRVPDGMPHEDAQRMFAALVRDPRWSAVRAPALPAHDVRWGAPVHLFDGRTLRGWRPRHAGSRHGWMVRDGALANTMPVDDLVTRDAWTDFKLSLQFRLPPGSDSGIHLRGRYELQLTDRPEDIGDAGGLGSIYGRLAPRTRVACAPGQWHRLDITLVGRQVTVALDGTVIHDHASIAGITGDALDSREGEPGPLMLQGYTGAVEYRDLVLTPTAR